MRQAALKHGPVTIETRIKLSESHKGLLVGNKNPNWGRVVSEEEKQKSRERILGDKNPNYGRNISKEYGYKISQTRIERNFKRRK